MALNALRTEMVTFTGTPGIEVNGVVIGYKAEYTERTGTEAKYHAIEGRTSDVASDANHKGQYYIQLGEQLYDGKLRLNNNATDVFGRPSRYWEFNGKEIGTYMKKELVRAEYTKKVTGDTLYDLLTRNTVINYDVDVFIDGEITAPTGANANWWFTKNAINRNNDAGVGGTGNGVLTQVFVNDDAKVVTIAIINTYLAIATDNYSEKKDEAKFDVYGINRTTDRIYYREVRDGHTDKKDMKVTSELFDVKNIQKDDAVLVTVADKEIQTLVPAEILANTEIQSFETGSNSNDNGVSYDQSSPGNVVVDGTQYDFATAAEYDPTVMEYYTNASTGTVNLKDKTYNVYLDRYGYAIGIKELEGVNNYAFITGIDLNGSNLGNKNADASVIFLDGTMKTVKINMGKSEFQTLSNDEDDAVLNTWCTYTVNTDGIYTVKEVSHVNMNAGNEDGTAGHENYIPGKDSSNDLLGDQNRNNGKLAQYNETLAAPAAPTDPSVIKIDDKHISVAGRSKVSSNYSRVYGTDNTVYITVELAELVSDSSQANKNYGIINDVVSVNTGISNVSLEAWNTGKAQTEAESSKPGDVMGTISAGKTYAKAKTANGVYSLYNDNGDIIAMIVVGEDAGSTKNLVYAHKAATFKESYDKATGKWTWQRKVIHNGEEIILTEVDDGLSKLGSMVQHNWYQVKYNSDGNVIDVVEVTGTAPVGALTNDVDYEDDYEEIDDTINSGKDTVLYTSVADGKKINSQNLKMPGRTLFLNTAQTEGFRVATDVKTALIQWNNNDQKTYFESGVDSLRSIVEDLNERHTEVSKQHDYIISAVLEKGVATSVIIYDMSRVCDPYTSPDWGSGNATITVVGGTVTYTVPLGGTVPTPRELRDAVLKHLGEGWNPDRGDEFEESNVTPGEYRLKVNGMVYTVNLVVTLPAPSAPIVKIAGGAANGVKDDTDTAVLAATVLTANAANVNIPVTFADGTKDMVKFTVDNTANAGASVSAELSIGGGAAAAYTVGDDADVGSTLGAGIQLVLTVEVSGPNVTTTTFTYTVTLTAPGANASTAPTITGNLSTTPVYLKKNATPAAGLSVTATGASLSYQWQKKGPSDAAFADMTGKTTAALAAADIDKTTAGATQYKCVVTNTETGKTPTSVDSAVATVTVINVTATTGTTGTAFTAGANDVATATHACEGIADGTTITVTFYGADSTYAAEDTNINDISASVTGDVITVTIEEDGTNSVATSTCYYKLEIGGVEFDCQAPVAA